MDRETCVKFLRYLIGEINRYLIDGHPSDSEIILFINEFDNFKKKVAESNLPIELKEYIKDLRFQYSVKQIDRSPFYFVISYLTLGIWANAVMFGILDRILFQPPAHIENHEQIRRVYSHFNRQNRLVTSSTMSYPDFAALKGTRSFASRAFALSPGIQK